MFLKPVYTGFFFALIIKMEIKFEKEEENTMKIMMEGSSKINIVYIGDEEEE